jgi:AhpD family alkylhydroperoxidase
MARYLPVQLDAANDTVKAVYADVEGDLGSVPDFIKVLAHSGNFLGPIADAYRALMGETGLSEKIRQLVVLKTCRLDKCKSTIDRHSRLALDAGWTEEQLRAIDDYSDSALFTYYEREALQLVDFVYSRPDEIPFDYWRQLDNHYTSDQVVEMITLIGFTMMVNRLILSLELESGPRR